MKKFVAVFITFILIFSFTIPSYATVFEGLENVDPLTPLTPSQVSTTERGDSIGGSPADNNDGVIDGLAKKINDVLSTLSEKILGPVVWIAEKMPTIDGSIWAKQDTFQISFFDANPTGFSSSIQTLIGGLYNALRYMVAAIYVIILVYLGVRMILSSIGKQKAHYKTLLQYWLTGLLLLFAFHWIMAFAIWVSDTIVKMFAEAGTAVITGNAFKDLSYTSGTTTKTPTDITGIIIAMIVNPIADASLFTLFLYPLQIVLLVALIAFGLFISITYIKRLFTVALLIVLFPMVVLSYVFDKIGDRRSQTLSYWMKEFMTNVFVQPIHAILLLIISYLLSLPLILETPVVGPILALCLLSLLPIGEKQIKQLFQIGSNMGAGSGGLSGAMSTLAHAGMVGSQLKKMGMTATSGLRERLDKTKNKLAAIKSTNDAINTRANNKIDRALKNTPSLGDNKAKLKEMKRNAKKIAWNELKNDEKYKAKMAELGQKSGSSIRDLMTGNTIGGIAKAGAHRLTTKDGWIKNGKAIKDRFATRDGWKKTGRFALNAGKGAIKGAQKFSKYATVSAGAGIGLAKGLISSTDLEQLPENIIKGSLTGAAAGMLFNSAIGNAGKSIKGLIPGNQPIPEELKDAEVLAKLKLSELSQDEKQKLAKAAGLDVSVINDDNKELINDRISTKKKLASYGLKYNDTAASVFNSDSAEVANLLSGKDAYTGENLNTKDYDSMQTKTALYLRHKRTGQTFQLNGYGNANASDNPTWRNGELSAEKFINDEKAKAKELVKNMNGDGIGANNSAFSTQKQYDDYLNKEILRVTKDATTHNNTLLQLQNTSHDIMERKTAQFNDSVENRFHTMEDARSTLSNEAWSKAIEASKSYTDDLVLTPNDATSRNNIFNKISALEQGNLPFSLESICNSAGCSYDNFKKRKISDSQLAQIATAVQQEYQNAPEDIQKTVLANVIDMETRANNTIEKNIVNGGTLSDESINTAVSYATDGAVTNITQSNKLKEFLATQSIETKQKFINYTNVFSADEASTSPFAPTIVAAQREGKLNTNVSISNVPSNINQILGMSSDKMAVEAKLYKDPNTGGSKITLTNLTDPSKKVTLDTDMPADGNSTTYYGAEVSIDSNGAPILKCAEKELHYTFDSISAPVETFSDIKLSDLQAWTQTKSTKFSLIRNSDICAVVDENNQIILVKEGLMPVDKLTQFNVEAENDELKIISTVFDSVDRNNKFRFRTYCERNKNSKPDEVKLINRLFNKS